MTKRNKKHKVLRTIIILIILLVMAYQEYLEPSESIKVTNDLNIYFIDVGQADSILITTNTHNMLIDAGNNSDGNLLVDYISSLNINNFEYIVGTHPHEDHIGGMDDIINNFKINKIYLPKSTTTSKTFTDLLNAIKYNNLKITIPKDNEIFYLGEAKIEVIYNGGEQTEDLNASSIILKLTYGNNTFMLTGDAPSEVEKLILDKDISADVLKVSHHGSEYSTSTKFLQLVNPKYAIISVGKNNDYNHPSSKTINKLNQRDIKIYRTDKLGTIKLTSDGKTITITNEKTNTNG